MDPVAAQRAGRVSSPSGVEGVGRLPWSQAAGVFDYWLNNGSYMPTWEPFWPCQTSWGILP